MSSTLYWHRHDLRLGDNPALSFAVEQGAVQPVFILDTTNDNPWPYGAASKWWLHHSLESLQESYKKAGVALLLLAGDPVKILPKLLRDTKATCVVWNRRYDAYGIAQDKFLKESLPAEVKSFNGNLLLEPWQIKTKTGENYKVFTPFWRALSAQSISIDPLAGTPHQIKPFSPPPEGLNLNDLDLRPTKPDWAKSFEPHWTIGETEAQQKLDKFLDNTVIAYKDGRDFPAQDDTSRLSPHLAFGEISPRQIWYATQAQLSAHKKNAAYTTNADHFLREVAWREFAYHLLYQYPDTPTEPLYPKFKAMKWKKSKKHWDSWTKGQTGYPIVDAGMRQLWQTGYMHNRVRMIVASFLIKDLMIAWQDGATWFWDTLVDADLANNTLGWQWTAGCGADASPYYRIFNPGLQSAKFDKNGDYIRTYVPELAKLPAKYIHEPWKAPPLILKEAGVILGKDYPEPIIDHATARDYALQAFKELV
ncbi:MAG TPA: deoxyribodipyrimidine photo-lyase [Alphaproteobacteria bacterium]